MPNVETLRALEIVRAPMRAVPPMAPCRAMLPPPAASVRLPPPLTVLASVMFCEAAAVLKIPLPERVIGPEKLIGPPAVICPDRVVCPVLDWVKAPATENMAPLVIFNRPELAIETGPAAVVVTVLL